MVTVIIIIIVLLFHNNNNYCRTETSAWRVSTKTGTESSETSDISGQLWVLTELGSLWLDWYLSVILRLLLDPRYQWNIDISCQTNQWKLEFSWTFLYCQIFSVLEAELPNMFQGSPNHGRGWDRCQGCLPQVRTEVGVEADASHRAGRKIGSLLSQTWGHLRQSWAPD